MKIRNKKDFKALVQALDDWYGMERSRDEISAHCPEAQDASQLMQKILKKTVDKDLSMLISLQGNWSQIAGPQIAGHSKPVCFADKILYVEVKHNIWLRELDTAQVKTPLINKVNKTLGKKLCKDIVFTI